MKERLSGVLVIRAFNTEKREEKRFDIANRDLTKINMFTNKAMSFMMPMLMFVMNGVSILIVWAGAHLVNEGSLMIGDMLAYLQYAMHVIMSFLFITMMFIMIPRAIVSAKRIGEVLDVEPSIEDPEMPETVEDHRGVVEFDHVSFSYPDAEKEVLEDISFTARPGRTTAIIGGTGSGKSTHDQVLSRVFTTLTEGSGDASTAKDVRDITQHRAA